MTRAHAVERMYCKARGYVFPVFPPSLLLVLLVQAIYGIRSKDSIGRAQPHESGHEQDAHG